jgi:hypothetical protein
VKYEFQQTKKANCFPNHEPRRNIMTASKKITWIAVLFAAGYFGLTNSAHATLTLLTGGDAGDGWTAPGSYVLAYNPGDVTAVNKTVQSVTFLGWNRNDGLVGNTAPTPPSGISVTSNSIGGFSYGMTLFGGVGGSTNDQALAGVLKAGLYNNGGGGLGPLTFTITGLTNGTYRVDEFYQENTGVSRDIAFAVNGTTINSFTTGSNESWLFQTTVVVSGGTLTLDITSPSFGTPSLQGFVVSAVPEPSAISILGIGAIALIRRWRRLAR